MPAQWPRTDDIDDAGRSCASTLDPLDDSRPVGAPDPLLEHDPLHNGLDCLQHHALLKNSGSLSFSADAAHVSTVSKCYRLSQSLLLFIAMHYDVLPSDAQESAADLQAEAMDTHWQESLCFILDEYVLRSNVSRPRFSSTQA
jgi:hypothetical protein